MKLNMKVASVNLKLIDLFIRIAVLPLPAASLGIMVSNNQASESYGRVEFRNLTGSSKHNYILNQFSLPHTISQNIFCFRYLVWISAISCGYSLFSIVLSCFRWFNCDWLLFVLDQITGYLLVTSGSAVIEILYLAHEGDKSVTWSEVCSFYGKFCSNIKMSLVFHIMALMCFLALSLFSGYRLFSKFEAPSLSSSTKDESMEIK